MKKINQHIKERSGTQQMPVLSTPEGWVSKFY